MLAKASWFAAVFCPSPVPMVASRKARTKPPMIFDVSFMFFSSLRSRLLPQHRGRDYSRSNTGTGMPLKNAFGTPSCGRASAMLLRSVKLPVSCWTAAKAADCFVFRFFTFIKNFSTDGLGFTPFAGHFLEVFFASAKKNEKCQAKKYKIFPDIGMDMIHNCC
jgi:hypothetical protein